MEYEIRQRLPYLIPSSLTIPLGVEDILCVSTGTEPFENNGNYDWGS